MRTYIRLHYRHVCSDCDAVAQQILWAEKYIKTPSSRVYINNPSYCKYFEYILKRFFWFNYAFCVDLYITCKEHFYLVCRSPHIYPKYLFIEEDGGCIISNSIIKYTISLGNITCSKHKRRLKIVFNNCSWYVILIFIHKTTMFFLTALYIAVSVG